MFLQKLWPYIENFNNGNYILMTMPKILDHSPYPTFVQLKWLNIYAFLLHAPNSGVHNHQGQFYTP